MLVIGMCADDKKCFQFLLISFLPLGLVIEENRFPKIYHTKYGKIVAFKVYKRNLVSGYSSIVTRFLLAFLKTATSCISQTK